MRPTRPQQRSADTRARILDTALAMFREHGYEKTTMRAIAESAGVSLGNAYYYFASKDHLIQDFYARTHVEHLAAVEPVLESETQFRARLLGAMHAKIDVNEPYHRFAALLFRSAADPESPLNPFSDASRPTREESIALMRRVVDGSTNRMHKDVRQALPELLWLYEMGIILFWIHDRSAERKRTRFLVDRTVDLIARLVSLVSLPGMRAIRSAILRLISDLQHDMLDGPGAPAAEEDDVPSREEGP